MTTETYQHVATVLNQLLGNDRAVRLTVSGYRPLSVEDIGKSPEGNRLISICHYGEQHGDLMRDPDMVFEVYAAINAAEPLSYRNDYMGIMQEVYIYNDAGKKAYLRSYLKNDLTAFANTWFETINDQGFLGPQAVRDRLA